jgi:hypothetical protein
VTASPQERRRLAAFPEFVDRAGPQSSGATQEDQRPAQVALSGAGQVTELGTDAVQEMGERGGQWLRVRRIVWQMVPPVIAITLALGIAAVRMRADP